MATRDRGGLSAQGAVGVSTDSESESSYAGSGESSPHPSNSGCRWRTARFNDQECSRYFDCPSHIVERALSNSEGEDDEEEEDSETHMRSHAERGQREREDRADVEMESHDGDHSSRPGTVSPVSEDNGGDAGESLRSPGDVSPLPDAPTAGEDEIEITGNPNPSDVAEVDRPSTSRQGASGTAENPIVLLDDSPPPTLSRQQPYTMASTASSSRAEPVIQQTAPTSSSNQPSVIDVVPASRDGEPMTIGEFLATSGLSSPSVTRPAPRSPDLVLPRWQPDAEVTYCPICRTQFSIFVRKHHCR